MNDVHNALLKLQELDKEIHAARARAGEYGPQLEELEAPLAELEAAVASSQKDLEGTSTELRRLERAAEEKRVRQQKYEEHLERARNAREETAARAELDLVRKAVEADEREALERMEAVTRIELRLDELGRKLDEARQEAGPVRDELEKAQEAANAELAVLEARRSEESADMDSGARQLYEQVRGGRTRTVVVSLTADGACGHCFSMIPIQRQTEIRRGGELVRCEACGVILFTEE
ncbi:MAG: C4-type zinc ribbon domain-containing protein [Gemmatimonadota bacterium]